jgi:hypothetical protein
MSAWIVRDRTINEILNFLGCSDAWYINPKFKEMTCEEAERYGKKLLKMNYQAVNCRYENTYKLSKDDLRKINSFCYVCEEVNEFRALKGISCFLYQCAEGKVYKSKMFNELELIKHLIQGSIISKMPEYDKLEWR